MRQQARKLEIEARKRRCRLYVMIGSAIAVIIFIIIMLIANNWVEQQVHESKLVLEQPDILAYINLIYEIQIL